MLLETLIFIQIGSIGARDVPFNFTTRLFVLHNIMARHKGDRLVLEVGVAGRPQSRNYIFGRAIARANYETTGVSSLEPYIPRVSMRVWKVGGGKGRKIRLGTLDRFSCHRSEFGGDQSDCSNACQYHRYTEACDYISIVSDGFFG